MFRVAACKVPGKVGGVRGDDLFVRLLWLGLCGCAATMLAQTPGTFALTGNMTTARSRQTATLLQDGRVLIAGGGSAVVETYDPSTATFTATSAKTRFENVESATLLPDGKVLLIENGSTRVAELFDPVAGAITATGQMLQNHSGSTATLLTNGKVLVTGGDRDPELYDPSTQYFSYTGSYADTGAPFSTPGGMNVGLLYSAAALLPNGKVLVASEPIAEVYDPSSGTFALAASVPPGPPSGDVFVEGREATLLANGEVLLSGGDLINFDCGDWIRVDAELYDPLAGTFRSTGNMALPRWQHTATLLPDGTVLIIGGIWPSGGIHLTELYNPDTASFAAAGNLIFGRALQQATLLGDGRVLITGGVSLAQDFSSDTTLASAELYTPAVLVPAPRLFSLSGDGKGQGAIWDPKTGQVPSAGSPGVAGEVLSMYTTSLIDGGLIPPQIAIGGSPAQVLYFGPSSYPGYYQVNMRVPSGVAPGDSVPVRLTYIGRSSNEVTIAVR